MRAIQLEIEHSELFLREGDLLRHLQQLTDFH